MMRLIAAKNGNTVRSVGQAEERATPAEKSLRISAMMSKLDKHSHKKGPGKKDPIRVC